MDQVILMHHRSIPKQCQAKEVLIVHIYRHLRLLVGRRVRISSVTVRVMLLADMTNLDIVGDMVILSISMIVEGMSRRNFVPIKIRIALGAVIVILGEAMHKIRPRPSRETKDMGNRPVEVVVIVSSPRPDIIRDRALDRHIARLLRSNIVRRAEAEENN